MPSTLLKAYRLAPETVDRIEYLGKLWSQAKPLSGARVLDEAVARIWQTEARKKTSRKSREDP